MPSQALLGQPEAVWWQLKRNKQQPQVKGMRHPWQAANSVVALLCSVLIMKPVLELQQANLLR